MGKYLKMPPRSALQLLAGLALVGGIVWLGASLLGGGGGDDDGGGAETALAFNANQDTWVPGQAPLSADPFYLQILGSATASGDQRFVARERLIRLIAERKKRAAEEAARRAREEAERRRREQLRALARLRAQRARALARARAKYREALRKAAEEKRKAAEEKRRREAELRRKRRELERKRRIKPGEECRFKDVRKQYDCEEGRL